MNNGIYTSYIIGTDYYKNLSNAVILINEISKDINNLKQVLEDAQGDIIVEMVNDLHSLERKLESYKASAKSIQSDLKANAIVFDSIYDLWKGKIGEVVDEGYYVNTSSGLRKYSLTQNPIGEAIKINSINSLPVITKQEAYKAWSYKYKTKISKVYLETESNLPKIEYTDYFECYTKGVILLTIQVNCIELFQEENRDTTKDYSKLIGVSEIDLLTQLPKTANTTFWSQ